MESKLDAGTRDRLVLCGQFAVEALGLGDNNNAPNDVRAAINKLRKERGEFEVRAILLEQQLATAKSALEQIADGFDVSPPMLPTRMICIAAEALRQINSKGGAK